MKFGPRRNYHKGLEALRQYANRFQPGEGPSRGLLRDYEPSDGTFSSTSLHVGGAVVVGSRVVEAGLLLQVGVVPQQLVHT